MFLLKLIHTLKTHQVNYAVAGGYAVSLHGAPRGTMDVDLIIALSEEQLERCEKALRKLGLVSRVPVSASEVFQFRKEYMTKRNMLAWGFINPSNPTEMVDILLMADVNNITVDSKMVAGKEVRLISLKDLIKLKSQSERPQDIEDVKALKTLL